MENSNKSSCCSGLSICNFGMASGIALGLSMFMFAILSMLFGLATPFVDIFAALYWGYDSTVLGALLGLLWGFVHGFVFGALLAYTYNFCYCKCPCNYCKNNRKCCDK